MISIERIDDYCQDCPYFSASTDTIYYMGGLVIHYIGCENSDRCRRISAYILKKLKEEKKDG